MQPLARPAERDEPAPVTVTATGQLPTVDIGGMTRNINHAGAALIATTGPLAVVIAFFVGVSILNAGKEKIKTFNIPPLARKLGRERSIVTDLRARAATNEGQLATKPADELKGTLADELTAQITKDIIVELNSAADRAELLIR